VPSIFALGDVSTRMQLTPVALAEAMVVVDALFADPKQSRSRRKVDYEFTPTAVFTTPTSAPAATPKPVRAEVRRGHDLLQRVQGAAAHALRQV